MTLKEAIDHVDTVKPNVYTLDLKVKWLSKLDGMIFRETFQTHADSPIKHFHGYKTCDLCRALLVPYPFDEDVYNYFLQAQIDKENGEAAKYNQSITLYNNAVLAFQNWYNRTHMPLPERSSFIL